MYSGNLTDSFQLAVTVNCLTLLVIITAVYLIYYYQTREKAFVGGCLLTADVALFVLAETLIIVQGWNGNIMLGRQLHRAEQIPIFLFLAILPFFINRVFPAGGKLKKIINIFFWLGLAVTAAAAAAGYIFPDLLVSVDTPSLTSPETPGDFTRGLEGPLYQLRDIMLGAYIVLALVYSGYYLVKNGRNFQNIMFLAGIAVSIFGAFDDIQYLYSGWNILLNGLRFSRFILGSTVMLLFFLAAVFDEYFKAHMKLKKAARDLKVSENRYSMLMDATDEIMFSLSRDLTIISANEKAEKIFHLLDEPVNFIDCLFQKEVNEESDNQYFREQLMELDQTGEKLSFNTYIKDWNTLEPVEYHFRFDCFADEDFELIGRAWPAARSKLLEFVETERLTLNVDNYIFMVGDIVDRLTRSTKRYLEEGDVMMIKMGLQEMIVNAMEHGNLNVTFDEKTEAQEQGRLFDFMSERRQLPEYRDKKVTIDYFLDDSRVIYRITDMGPGFDYQKIMNRVQGEVNQLELSHGRGIIMTQAVFTSVEYNSRGNQVLLVKEFDNRED